MRAAGLGLLCVLCSSLPSGGAAAQVPDRLPLRGVLSDRGGEPIDGEIEVRFAIYAERSGGDPLFSETDTIEVERGRFTTFLGATKPLDLSVFAAHTDLFLGVQVGDDEEATPRMRLGSVPFAASAQHAHEATTLDGRGLDELQPRIVGSCDDGQAMVAVEADGAVVCEEVSTLPGPPGERGPAGEQGPPGPRGERGATGPVVQYDCAGQAVSALDAEGRATCVPLARVEVAAGTGLAVTDCGSGTCEIGVAAQAIGMEQVDLPMSHDWQPIELFSGVHFYETGPVFVPASDGQCLVLASWEMNQSVESTTGYAELRANYTEDGAPGSMLSLVGFASAIGGEARGGAFQSTIVPVRTGRSYRFGCTILASGDWVGRPGWCQITRFCQ